MTMRRLMVVLGVVLAAVAGVASASVMTSADPTTPVDGGPSPEQYAVSDARGEAVADPRGGPPWAVRILADGGHRRCITVGRTDGKAFGRLDESGRVVDVPPLLSGDCGDPAAQPLQLAISNYAATPGQEARSVLFGVVAPDVAQVSVVAPDGPRAVTVDRARTFAVVYEGISPITGWSVTVTSRDGSVHTYGGASATSIK